MSRDSSIRAWVFAIALALGSACGEGGDTGVRDLPPGTCVADQRVCHWDPSKQVETVLRCNAGEVPDAIWLIELACEPGDLCIEAACAPAS
jgi:hypothetical protein